MFVWIVLVCFLHPRWKVPAALHSLALPTLYVYTRYMIGQAVLMYVAVWLALGTVSWLTEADSSFSGTDEDRALLEQSRRTVREATRSEGRQVFFEDWVLSRNRTVRMLRHANRERKIGLMARLRRFLKADSVIRRVGRAEERLLNPRLQYRAFKRLPRRTTGLEASDFAARPRKRRTRPRSRRRVTKHVSVVLWILLTPPVLVLTFFMFRWSQPLAAVVLLVCAYKANGYLTRAHRWGREWEVVDGPRKVLDKVCVPDDPAFDPVF